MSSKGSGWESQYPWTFLHTSVILPFPGLGGQMGESIGVSTVKYFSSCSNCSFSLGEAMGGHAGNLRATEEQNALKIDTRVTK